MRKFTLAIVMASTAFAVAPASAQSWRPQPSIQRQIQVDMNQLDRQIQRAQQRRAISPREATALKRQARDLQRTYKRYNRNGLDRREVAQLEALTNRLRQNLRLERRDWDGRRG